MRRRPQPQTRAKTINTIKAVSFDLDDTLWPVRPVLIGAEKKSSAFLQQHCPQLFERFTFDDMNSRRIALYQSRPDLHHQISQLRIESVRALLLECELSEDQAEQLALQAFDVFLQARHDVDYFDGAQQVLAQLQQRYQLAALTNGNADVMRLSIGGHFELSLKAEDLNSSKPAAPHFERTLSHFDIRAEQLVHVGDHPEHDVQGAQQLGIKTVWVNAQGDSWPTTGPAPDAEIQHIAELPAVIAALDS